MSNYNEDPHESLEVSPKASDEVIKNAYRALAKKWHPDTKYGHEKRVAEGNLKTINLAYELLCDPVKKLEYDQYRNSSQNDNSSDKTSEAKSNSNSESKSNSNQESNNDSYTNNSTNSDSAAKPSNNEQQFKSNYDKSQKAPVAESGFIHFIKFTMVAALIIFVLFSINNFISYSTTSTFSATPITSSASSNAQPTQPTLAPVSSVSDLQTNEKIVNSIPSVHYTNARYGFSIERPSSFTVQDQPPINGDGMSVHTPNGLATISVYGSNIIDNEDINYYYQEELKSHTNVAYKAQEGNWYVVSWSDEDNVGYTKGIVGKGSMNAYIIQYPKTGQQVYSHVFDTLSASFKTPGIDEGH